MAGQGKKRKTDNEDATREGRRKVLKVVDEQDPLRK